MFDVLALLDRTQPATRKRQFGYLLILRVLFHPMKKNHKRPDLGQVSPELCPQRPDFEQQLQHEEQALRSLAAVRGRSEGAKDPVRTSGSPKESHLAENTTTLINGAEGNATSKPQLPLVYHSAGRYLRGLEDKTYIEVSRADIRLFLQAKGFDVDSDDISPIHKMKLHEYCLFEAQEKRNVDYVGHLAGHQPGEFRTLDGRLILVTRGPRLIFLTQGSFENLDRFFAQLLEAEQYKHFKSYMKVALEQLYPGKPGNWKASQLVVFAGPPSCGKSLAQHLITAALGGRSAKPYRYMTEKTEFNADLAAAEHLMIEDENASKDTRSRRTFGSKIKEYTVNAEISVHGKGKDAMTLPTYRRVTLSVNDEAENLLILPPLDNSIKDRLILYKCSKAEVGSDRDQVWKTLAGELPAFIWHLLHEFEIDPMIQDVRYGIAAYHHPDLVQVMVDLQPETRLLELIEQVIDFSKGPWKGTAAFLEKELRANPEVRDAVASLLYYTSACGSHLGRLHDRFPNRFTKSKSGNRTSWTIASPDSIL